MPLHKTLRRHPIHVLRAVALLAVLGSALASTRTTVRADHSWNNYHWARTDKRFALQLGSNVLPEWDTALGIASEDWSRSKVLDTLVVPGQSEPQVCLARMTPGRVEVCSANHGRVIWLAIAQVELDGEHITAGRAVMNDYYFTRWLITFNQARRQQVMCHELGHTLGLDHQDEDFRNEPLGTCMDYSNDVTLNQHPDKHDYEQLELIYAHTDSFTSAGGASSPAAVELEDTDLLQPTAWGTLAGKTHNGGEEIYVRELGRGRQLVTFALLVPPEFR
jgi:hypothetical protein